MAEALSGLVGRHTFDEDQQEVFRYLVKQMRQCASVSKSKTPAALLQPNRCGFVLKAVELWILRVVHNRRG